MCVAGLGGNLQPCFALRGTSPEGDNAGTAGMAIAWTTGGGRYLGAGSREKRGDLWLATPERGRFDRFPCHFESFGAVFGSGQGVSSDPKASTACLVWEEGTRLASRGSLDSGAIQPFSRLPGRYRGARCSSFGRFVLLGQPMRGWKLQCVALLAVNRSVKRSLTALDGRPRSLAASESVGLCVRHRFRMTGR